MAKKPHNTVMEWIAVTGYLFH